MRGVTNMDRWTRLAFAILLEVVSDKRQARQVLPALAKLYIKIDMLSEIEPALRVEIERQEEKEAKK
jgi:hypothetical protein